MTTKLNDTDIAEQLAALNTTSVAGSSWQRDGDAITCTFTFIYRCVWLDVANRYLGRKAKTPSRVVQCLQ